MNPGQILFISAFCVGVFLVFLTVVVALFHFHSSRPVSRETWEQWSPATTRATCNGSFSGSTDSSTVASTGRFTGGLTGMSTGTGTGPGTGSRGPEK